MQIREELRNSYFVVALDASADEVRITRTSAPFPTVEDAVRGWLEVDAALDRLGRRGRCLLTDLRQGPSRNDPAFERAMQGLLPRLHQGFRRNAVLVRLAAGALQIRRHAREDGVERLVTSSEEEAHSYFRDGVPAPPSRRGSTQ